MVNGEGKGCPFFLQDLFFIVDLERDSIFLSILEARIHLRCKTMYLI